MRIRIFMNSQDFCFWLQGFLEISDAKTLDEKQLAKVKEHLTLVFTQVTGKSDGVQKAMEDLLRRPSGGSGTTTLIC